MADCGADPPERVACGAGAVPAGLFRVPLLQDVSRPAGEGQEPRRGDRRPASANDRSPRARDRGQRHHHRRSSAARARLRHRNRQGDVAEPERAGCSAGSRSAARYRQARGARTHHLETGAADSRGIRKDEDSSAGGRGDSGGSQVSLSRGSDRARAPRKMGRVGLSVRPFGRGNSDRAPEFSPPSIASTRWLRTVNTGGRCRWIRRWKSFLRSPARASTP